LDHLATVDRNRLFECPLRAMSGHNYALRELLALRDFYEAPGAPRQIPFGSDSRVQIADYLATTEPDIR
jgi:hypothetical protein